MELPADELEALAKVIPFLIPKTIHEGIAINHRRRLKRLAEQAIDREDLVQKVGLYVVEHGKSRSELKKAISLLTKKQ